MVKNLPAIQEMRVQSLGQEDPMEKEMATNFSILAWIIHRQESLVGYGPQSRKESHITERLTNLDQGKVTKITKGLK